MILLGGSLNYEIGNLTGKSNIMLLSEQINILLTNAEEIHGKTFEGSRCRGSIKYYL